MMDRTDRMDRADIRILTGDQGGGKSNTGTAYPVDDYFKYAVAVSPEGDKRYPIVDFYPKYTCKADGKTILVPKGYSIESPVKIFANYHLFGIKYAYCDLATLLEYLNSDLITDGWILMDESVMTDARNSMTGIGKIVAWFGASGRKRNLHFVLMTQFESMVEKRYRAFATTRVLCTYNTKTHYITLNVKEKGQRKKELTYYAPQYWRFFDTDERIKIPEAMVARALLGAR